MTYDDQITLSILMPCLNEARTLPTCIAKARAYLACQGFSGEIIVADNGSTDGSCEIAESLGARVIAVPEKGYGNALRTGIAAARGKYVVMGDADESYDFATIAPFVEKLEEGNDLVVGNRFRGGILDGAMPPLHRYFGNPLLTMLGRMLFKSPVKDFYCGLRGFRRTAMGPLNLSSPGMEFALEMIVKATINRLRISEVPTTLSPDGRDRPSHLRTWRDGFRSLRFFLLLSPEWLFLYPGLGLGLLSALASIALIFSDIRVGSVTFSYHTLIMTSALTIVSMQSVFFWVFAKVVAIQKKLLLADGMFRIIRPLISFRNCVVLGLSLIMGGTGIAGFALMYWYNLSFGQVESVTLIKIVCAASFLIAVGFQLVFASFLLALLEQKTVG